MTKVVVSEYLQEAYLDLLRVGNDVVSDPELYRDRTRLLEEVADADAIFIRNRTRVDADLRGLRGEMGGLRGEMNSRFEHVDARFEHIDQRFDALQRTMLQLGGGVIVALIGLIATQL